ncbi:MAG: metallophosphoesterase, partial [Phycisphaerae bacterium]
GGPGQKQVAAAMVQRAKIDGLGFMLTVGDNFLPKGVKSTEDPQWTTKFEDVYKDPALQVSIYALLGNHDHDGNPQAQIDYAKHNKRWTMPGFYYTFTRTLADKTKVQFFAIDSNPIHKKEPDAKVQLAWLDEELGKSDARWKIVFGHHPLYGHNPQRGHNQTMIAKLEPLLVKYKVDVYFAGHDHVLDVLKPVKGVHHVTSGGAAAQDQAYPVEWTDESYYVATLGGFTLCRVSKDELVIEFIRLDGKTQYAHTLRK